MTQTQPGRPTDTPRLPRLLSAMEAADALGLSVLTVRLWARHRKIPHRRIGSRILFAPDDIQNIIQRSLVPAREDR
jgi:excisionase family DNA binding protein